MPIDVAKEERPTIDPAIPTAFALNRRAARPQKTKPRTALPMLPARTQPPCSRTRAASDVGSVERTGLIQGNSQPSMTPTTEVNVVGSITIDRKGFLVVRPASRAGRAAPGACRRYKK